MSKTRDVVKTMPQRLSFGHRLVTLLFILALNDVVFSYFGRSLSIRILQQPWIWITAIASVALALNLRRLALLRPWALLSLVAMLLALAIGSAVIQYPAYLPSDRVTVLHVKDFVSITTAFLIGAMYMIRAGSDGRSTADILLFSAAIHALLCVIALAHLYPSVFPVIDSPYFRDGIERSRPEITTNQTRQILYLFGCLTTVFIMRSRPRLILSLLTSLAIVYVVSRVQSRWSAVIFPLFATIAYLMAAKYRVQPKAMLAGLLAIGVAVATIYAAEITIFLGDLLWRFTQVNIDLGGRMTSIAYLFEKLADPEYWAPRGYLEFYQRYGAAPHSFPAMVYLNGGIVALVAYIALIFLPTLKLLRLVVKGKANGLERIAFLCTSFAFALLMTQPVISHEIFWLFTGMAIGVISRRDASRVSTLVSRRTVMAPNSAITSSLDRRTIREGTS